MRVFKYRGGDKSIFKRDLDSLKNNLFYAPTKNMLNDPCEGLISEDILIKQIDVIAKAHLSKNPNIFDSIEKVKIELQNVLKHKDTSGIYSLSKSSYDELLWAHYANSHYGYCIEYELETLVYFGKNDFLNFDVKYTDKPPILSIDDMFKLKDTINFMKKIVGIKSKRWAYEKELRIITSQSGKKEYDYRALKAIYFGLRMPNEQKDEIMKTLQGRDIKYYQMELKNHTYKLSCIEIQDLYPTDKKYLYSISPIANYAVEPNSLNTKWIKFAPYLQKVAEIVRREPYCNFLEIVEISEEKSKPNKPVFFGQYKRSEFKWENNYYTPKEVNFLYNKINDLD